MRPESMSARCNKPQVFRRPATSRRFLRARRRFQYRCAGQANFVIGADQTLALGTRLFTKPDSRAQAAEQLRMLAGRSHELHSAVAVARNGKICSKAPIPRG